MSGYRYLKLNAANGIIQAVTTDEKVMNWFIEEVHKGTPSAQVYRSFELARISIPSGSEKKLCEAVIKHFVKHGWEPYAGTSPIGGMVWRHLRLRYDTHEF